MENQKPCHSWEGADQRMPDEFGNTTFSTLLIEHLRPLCYHWLSFSHVPKWRQVRGLGTGKESVYVSPFL